MSKIIVGVDPDSKYHGIAIYKNRELTDLKMWQLNDIIDFIEKNDCIFSIENVLANKFVYARNNKGNKAVTSKIAMSIGRCQQAQEELTRMLNHHGVPFMLTKPTKKNWAKDKKMFEAITGWTERSNEDTRSAAYFGYLAL
jgi:hypothetical protein